MVKPLIKSLCVMVYIMLFVILLVAVHLLNHFCTSNVNIDTSKFEDDYLIFKSSQYVSFDDIHIAFRKQINNMENILKIRKHIDHLNSNISLKINPEVIKNVPLVIVVQVNRRIKYLREFLKSLQRVFGIMNAILIFSHDYYDGEINKFIKSITWVKVIQIFYPYSKQLNPNIFPGNDQNYCNEGWKCNKFDAHRRNATLVQMKHHWWWKINFVFDHIDVLKPYNGPVVFLEEDQLLTEDFLYVLRLMYLSRKHVCQKCALSVGAYPPLTAKYNKNSTITIEEFGSTPSNMGVAFDREIWRRLKKQSQYFCYYDDYDWGRSLWYLTSRLPEGRLNMLAIAGTRVFHFGKCGVLYKGRNDECDPEKKKEALQSFVDLIKKNLYPKNFVIIKRNRYTILQRKGFFSDIRDHELCMYFTESNLLSI